MEDNKGKKVVSGGLVPFLKEIDNITVKKLLDFSDSKYYSAFEELKNQAEKQVIKEVKRVNDYDTSKESIAFWKAILVFWDSLLTVDKAAQYIVEQRQEKKEKAEK